MGDVLMGRSSRGDGVSSLTFATARMGLRYLWVFVVLAVLSLGLPTTAGPGLAGFSERSTPVGDVSGPSCNYMSGGAGTVRVDDFSVATGGTGQVASYDWDKDGRLTGETLPAGMSRTWDYTAGRLSGYTQTGAGPSRATTLGYDSSGRVGSETSGGQSTLFGYDDGGQLASVDAPGTSGDTAFTYTATGQRETATVGTAVTSYAYDTAGQLVS
ncbi:MAG: hypothetical protein WBF71_04595, partial [Microthrixaceae bacterium]